MPLGWGETAFAHAVPEEFEQLQAFFGREAISLLVPGRGLRGSAFNVIARLNGSGSWAVAADIETPEDELKIGTSFEGDPTSEDGGNTGRNAMVDGQEPQFNRLEAGPEILYSFRNTHRS